MSRCGTTTTTTTASSPKWISASTIETVAAHKGCIDPAARDPGDIYDRRWFAAPQEIVAAKGARSHDELVRCRRACKPAVDRTPHGEPIALQPRDFEP